MGAIADKLLYLNDTKSDLRATINGLLGTTIDETTPFRQYAEMADMARIRAMFDNDEQGGYWSADAGNFYEDSAGTIPASLNGVVGMRTDVSQGSAPQARRNLLAWSEDLLQTVWTRAEFHISQNSAISPDGTLTADKIIPSTVNTPNYYILQNLAVAPEIGKEHVYSLYVKADGYSWIQLFSSTGFDAGGPVSLWIYFNAETGEIGYRIPGDYSYGVSDVGNGWYRIWITSVSNSAPEYRFGYRAVPSNENALAVSPFAGNGTDGIFVWGNQLEQGTEPTPYQKIESGAELLPPGNHAYQQTTANKPYLRRTPTTNLYWADSNTATSALNATFSSSLGSACTVARVDPYGVSFLESQTIGTTYNIAPAFGWNGDVMVIDRALTVAEKAIVTRYMTRKQPTAGDLA